MEFGRQSMGICEVCPTCTSDPPRPGRPLWISRRACKYSRRVNPVQTRQPRDGSATSTSPTLTVEELADARAGFDRYLRGKGFSRAFIEEYAEDLMGKATVELARKIERGEEVKNAPGLLIHIAYRRTQNLLEGKSRAPDLVGLEAVAEVADDEDRAPEAETLDRDRIDKVRAAVARLTIDERKIVALQFFEDMNLSQAARSLGWDESKARRRHKAAMSHLKDLLGVDSSDQVIFDVAFMCWLAVAFGDRYGFNAAREIETIWHRVADLAVVVAERAQGAVHRATSRIGSDPMTAGAVGQAGRAAKVCGAALLCAVGAGAGVVVVGGQGGGTDPSHPGRGAANQSSGTSARRVVIPASVVSPATDAPSADNTSSVRRAKTAPLSSQRRQEGTVKEAGPAHASQPPPAEVISTLEETNRPTSGPIEPHRSVGAHGTEVGEVEKAGGKTQAIESLEAGRP